MSDEILLNMKIKLSMGDQVINREVVNLTIDQATSGTIGRTIDVTTSPVDILINAEWTDLGVMYCKNVTQGTSSTEDYIELGRDTTGAGNYVWFNKLHDGEASLYRPYSDSNDKLVARTNNGTQLLQFFICRK